MCQFCHTLPTCCEPTEAFASAKIFAQYVARVLECLMFLHAVSPAVSNPRMCGPRKGQPLAASQAILLRLGTEGNMIQPFFKMRTLIDFRRISISGLSLQLGPVLGLAYQHIRLIPVLGLACQKKYQCQAMKWALKFNPGYKSLLPALISIENHPFGTSLWLIFTCQSCLVCGNVRAHAQLPLHLCVCTHTAPCPQVCIYTLILVCVHAQIMHYVCK